MTIILRVPLLACALAAVAVVGADAAVAGGGPILAAAIALAAGLLTLLAADVPRRLLWAALAVTGLAQGMRVLLGPPPSVDERVVLALGAARATLAAPLRALVPEPEAGILLGIVLGERASIGPELRAAFADSGTTHLLAISGFNMTLVAAGVALVLRGRVGPVACACVTVGAVGLYSLLVGLTGSVARAALMAAVAAVALALGRPSAAWNALGAAVLAMLLLEPGALGDLGLLLSAAATAGLIAWQRALSSRLGALPGPVREGLAATLAATGPTLPIIAAAFGRVSLVSPLANLLAVPLFAPAILLGIATSAIGALWLEAAHPVALAAFAVTSALRWVVEGTASLPLAAVDVPPGPLTGAALAGTIVALVVCVRRASARVAIPTLRSPPSIAALELAPLGAVVAAAARIPARAVVA
ncbi:MAG: ComEC/Rec2 family competence protein, partial [Candidatus Limnocylindria bacterium]